jgi:hypothetical protein
MLRSGSAPSQPQPDPMETTMLTHSAIATPAVCVEVMNTLAPDPGGRGGRRAVDTVDLVILYDATHLDARGPK